MGTSSALFAYELGIFNELFVIIKVAGEVAHIFHVAQVFVVFKVRHSRFLHFSSFPYSVSLSKHFANFFLGGQPVLEFGSRYETASFGTKICHPRN
jgi:hypothetical protein